MPDDGGALSGLLILSGLASPGIVVRVGGAFCRMTAAPYPACSFPVGPVSFAPPGIVASSWRGVLPDGGGALSGLLISL
ncbi:hypothetical protein DMH17_12485 [Raoultella planticola]|nr:hypothetical protein [Raoultella planticola]